MSRAAAEAIYTCIQADPGLLICPASGNSPRMTYDLVAGQIRENGLKHALRMIALDEWVGMSQDNPHSSGYQLKAQLSGPLGIEDAFLFDGNYADEATEIRRADDFLLQNGPIDLCILGIGTNGHLGLNEPADFLTPPVHRARLAESTRGHLMVAGSAFKPEYGITLGMKDILASKKILLLVNGTHKRAVMTDFFSRKISTQLPASFLWLHPDVTCLCDRAAVPEL